MRSTWFISDTHFGHDNILKYCRQQFLLLEDMESTIISNWNRVVKKDDLVYHLGDFAWSTKYAKRVRPLLNGTIRLIVGNHDDIPGLAATGMFQQILMWKQFREHGFTITHVPICREQIRHGDINVHGHVHSNLQGLEHYHIDVSVESIDYRPIHLEEILRIAQERRLIC